MRVESIRESRRTPVHLSDDQARVLSSLGRRLATHTTWWGAVDESDPPERSVIDCHPTSTRGTWQVTVRDAIGVIGLPDLQIQVEPKIRADHFWHIATRGDWPVRLDEQQARLGDGTSLWEMVARWFVSRLEVVLRSDLLRDYREETAQLVAVSGRVVALATARDFYAGRIRPTCEYQEYDADTAPNRVLKAAAEVVAQIPIGTPDTRKRGRRLASAMFDVGDLRAEDVSVALDRRAAYYREAHFLARQILANRLRDPTEGPVASWSFLVRTPDLVEAGIREILKTGLGPRWTTAKVGRQLGGTRLRLQPDLVFNDGAAIGDVKYKLQSGDWDRPDLYQITTFATGYQTRRAAMVSFTSAPQRGQILPRVQIGDVTLDALLWRCAPGTDPEIAERDLLAHTTVWLDPHHPLSN